MVGVVAGVWIGGFGTARDDDGVSGVLALVGSGVLVILVFGGVLMVIVFGSGRGRW